MDPVTGVLTGESFTLKYHDVEDVLDFLVLRQYYELAIQRNWQPGDRFRCIIDDLWWEGQLVTREPYNAQFPDSMFLCYRIRLAIVFGCFLGNLVLILGLKFSDGTTTKSLIARVHGIWSP